MLFVLYILLYKEFMQAMTESTNKPFIIDFSNIREERQKINNNIVYDIIKSTNLVELKKQCNIKELNRILTDYNISLEELVEECNKNELLAKMTSGRISKLASRQGSSDEAVQIQTCNKTSSKYCININQLPNDALRPCKDGTIVSKEKFKLIPDKNSCLKSFDAEITGILQGYVFAKVVYGNGGHQDNVFEESYTFADWVSNFGDPDLLYVLLIDTDLTTKFEQLKIKAAEQKNLLVVNHIEFQQYIIDNY
jgi:hypothetical protein